MKEEYSMPIIKISRFSARVAAALSGTDGVDITNKALNEKSIVNVQKVDLKDMQFN